MELEIQKRLRADGLEATVARLDLKVSVDPWGLTQLNYKVTSPKTREVCECRGLILDPANDWRVVAYPFYRFFNDGEGAVGAVEPVNLATAQLQEKLDGSLIILYWHPYLKQWTVATRGRGLADGQVGDNQNLTFASLFWSAMPKKHHELCDGVIDHESCFMLELVSPANRVVTLYQETAVYLIGGRWLISGNEMAQQELDMEATLLGIRRPRTFGFTTRDDIAFLIGGLSAIEEGYVVVDYSKLSDHGGFARMKVKNPRYLALAHLVGAGTELSFVKKIVRLVMADALDELVVYFPEYEKPAKDIRDRLTRLAKDIDDTYYAIENLKEKRKVFAAQALTTRFSGALFNLADGRYASGWDYLMSLREEQVVQLLEVP